MKNMLISIIFLFLSHSIFAQEEINSVTENSEKQATPQNAKVINKKVNLKKGKDGSNIYNFNFYHDNEKKEENSISVKPEEKKTSKVPTLVYRPERYKVGGSGFEISLFTLNQTDEPKLVGDLDIGPAFKLGFSGMNSSGFFISPGFIVGRASADAYTFDEFGSMGSGILGDYDGTATGAYIKLGKMFDVGRVFKFIASAEYSYVSGKLDSSSASMFRNSGEYDFNISSYTINIGPAWKMKNFILNPALSVGKSKMQATESQTSTNESSFSTISFGDESNDSNESMSRTNSDVLSSTVVGFSLTGSFLF